MSSFELVSLDAQRPCVTHWQEMRGASSYTPMHGPHGVWGMGDIILSQAHRCWSLMDSLVC